jgi:hypothetical protein
MRIPEYPQDVTEDEAALGFARWIIPSILDRDTIAGMFGVRGLRPFVVAKILSSYEVLVKISNMEGQGVVYSHRIYGTYGEECEADWMPIGNPIKDAGIYLQELKSGAIELNMGVGHGFKRLKFRHARKAIFWG